MANEPVDNSQILLYQTEDGRQRIEVRLNNDTVWLSQKGISELFQTTLQNLEQLVSQYLDFTERQARNRKVMHMIDWKTKLDAFLQVNDEKILT